MEKEDTEEYKIKGELCDLCLNKFKELTPYRIDDAWDWLCDNVDLDNNFPFYLEQASKELYNKSFDNFYLNVDKEEFSTKVAQNLIEFMEEKLWEEK